MLKGQLHAEITSIPKKDKNGIRVNHVERANCMHAETSSIAKNRH